MQNQKCGSKAIEKQCAVRFDASVCPFLFLLSPAMLYLQCFAEYITAAHG